MLADQRQPLHASYSERCGDCEAEPRGRAQLPPHAILTCIFQIDMEP